ncbi:MAG: hypothetical protein Kow0068_19140 [Marinilabiliales bacterium]
MRFWIIILFIFFLACKKKETNEIDLFLNNKILSDTLQVKFFYTSGDFIEKTFYPDSNTLFYFTSFVSSPNEIMIKNFDSVKCVLRDTSFLITPLNDTTNNLFTNNRWKFVEKRIEGHKTNFNITQVNVYEYVFEIKLHI